MFVNHLSRRSFFRASVVAGGATLVAARTAFGAPADAADAAHYIKFFDDPELNFNVMFALGETAYGAGETGEILATVDKINRAGASYQTFCDGFTAMAERTDKIAEDALESGHRVSARSAFLRSAQYYNQALFFVLGTDKPDSEAEIYGKMQRQWNAAANLFEPALERVRIPYEDSYLPGYFLKSGGNGPRPTVIVMNGSDAQLIDVYAFGGAAATERGWNALIFEAPGQGSMLFERKIPFRPDWENVITPVVDFLTEHPDVDGDRIALTGWSFGGALVARAAAFEKRLAAVVADPGFVDGWEAYPDTLRGIVEQGGNKEQVDNIWQNEVIPELTPENRFTLSKRSEIYGGEFLEAAREGRMFDSLWDLSQAAKQYQVADVAAEVEAPMLVTQYEREQFFPDDAGQRLYDLLTSPKTLVTFTAEEGAAFHDSPLAPQRRNQVVFDWLNDTVGAQD